MHAFVDESKAKGYTLVAAVMLPADLVPTRKVIRELVSPGRTRVHMKREIPRRRKLILAKLRPLGPVATLYSADRAIYGTDIACRRACLEALVHDIADTCQSLVLEADATQDARDRQDLITLTKNAGCRDSLSYEHLTATTEPLLAIPDAVAWAWARGGEWRSLVKPLIKVVRMV